MPADGQHFRFDRTINAGHILTTGAMLLAFIGAWYRLESRVTSQEEQLAALRQTTQMAAAYTDQRINRQREDMQMALTDIKRQLERIEAKLDGKADRR